MQDRNRCGATGLKIYCPICGNCGYNGKTSRRDYIITHCCSTSVLDELSGGFYQADALTDFLEEVTQRCKFKYHFFGHYHMDRNIQKKYVLLYEQIIRLKL